MSVYNPPLGRDSDRRSVSPYQRLNGSIGPTHATQAREPNHGWRPAVPPRSLQQI